MKRTILALACLATSLLAGAQSLEIRGSTVVEKDVLLPAAAEIKARTGVELKVIGMSSGRAMVALFERKTEVAAVSETLEEAVASARKAAAESGSAATAPTNLAYHEIGRDRIAVFIHRDNPVASLSRQQIKAIFTGTARNWKEVGGPDMPIRIFASSPGSGTRAVFQKLALDGADLPSGVQEFRTSLAAIVEVGKDKGGVAVAGPGLLDDAKSSTLKIVSTPAFERPLGLVTVGKPGESAQKVIDFLRARKK